MIDRRTVIHGSVQVDGKCSKSCSWVPRGGERQDLTMGERGGSARGAGPATTVLDGLVPVAGKLQARRIMGRRYGPVVR